jgi:hypothetical protein
VVACNPTLGGLKWRKLVRAKTRLIIESTTDEPSYTAFYVEGTARRSVGTVKRCRVIVRGDLVACLIVTERHRGGVSIIDSFRRGEAPGRAFVVAFGAAPFRLR